MFKRSATALFSLAALAAFNAQAATIPLTQDGHFFKDWVFNKMPPPPGVSAATCSGLLRSDAVIQETLGSLNFTVTAEAGVAPLGWQTCQPWVLGGAVPTGNDLPGTGSYHLVTDISSVNYNNGNYNIVADRPFVPGSLIAFQDMDRSESALLTFKDCQGNAVDPAAFDTVILSSNYVPSGSEGPIASSQYAGGTPPAWEVKAQTGPTQNVPNVSLGVLMKAPNICSIRLAGSTVNMGTGGGTTFYLASPPSTTFTVNTGITGGPADFSATLPVTPRCTVDGVDITAMLTPQPPQNTTASQGTPGQVVFSNVPAGAQCTVSAQSSTPAPQGLIWGPAPTAGPVTIDADASKNVVTLIQPLSQPAPVPTLGAWALLALAGLLGGTVALRRRVQ